jgi:hypothetical protein
MEETVQNQSNIASNPVGFPGAPTVPPTSSKKNWKWLVILVLFLVVIGGVTFFVFKSSKSASVDQPTSTPLANDLTNVATPAATPTSAPVDKTKLNVSVLNGTGIAGEAGLLSDQLKSLGYTNITTGNASAQNATNTVVAFSSTISSDVVSEITSKLNSLYTNVTTDNSALPSGVDIQITTGLRKGQTAPAATDAPTSTPTATPAQ